MALKFDTRPASLTYPANSHEELASSHRLIALVPTNTDFGAATQRICGLAHTTGMHIRLFGLCRDTTEESRLRRELITMASLLQDGRRDVEASVQVGTNWMQALQAVYKTGDALVCFADQQTGILHKPLNQILEENFKATIYVLSDLTPQKSTSSRLSRIVAWLVNVGVIAGFGLLQIKIIQLPAGWLQSLLLVLSILPEFWLIWVWNGRLG